MNKIMLVGRLATEIKMEKSGETKYGRFYLAVSRRGKKDEADFIACAVFGKTAQTMFEWCRKGHRIGIEGHLQISRYEKNGEKKSGYSVIVETMEFLQTKNEKSGDTTQAPTEPVKDTSGKTDEFVDDEFPF